MSDLARVCAGDRRRTKSVTIGEKAAASRGARWSLIIVLAAGMLAATESAAAQDLRTPPGHPSPAEPDNGTDPTRVRRSATVDFEHIDLRGGFTSDTIEFVYSQPLAAHAAVQVTVPLPSVDTAGNDKIGFGDVELLFTHIPVVTRKYGIVLKAGATFDTASRPELGAGQTVLEATFIYARFLRGGAIFAPSFEFDYGVNRDPGRSRTKQLTVDFYYVPKFKNSAYYMTVDPFVNFDFEAGKQSGGLSITLGRVLGPAFGGRAQAYVKPSVFVGADRGANWGVETGIKLLGF